MITIKNNTGDEILSVPLSECEYTTDGDSLFITFIYPEKVLIPPEAQTEFEGKLFILDADHSSNEFNETEFEYILSFTKAANTQTYCNADDESIVPLTFNEQPIDESKLTRTEDGEPTVTEASDQDNGDSIPETIDMLNIDAEPQYPLHVFGEACLGQTYIKDGHLVISQTTGDGKGISLYSESGEGPMPDYGISFAKTDGFGSHGYLTGTHKWATYFNMRYAGGDGWIFRSDGKGNIASISTDGYARFNGNVRTSALFLNNDDVESSIYSMNKEWLHYKTNALYGHFFYDTVTVNQEINPYGNNSSSLGNDNKRWKNIFTENMNIRSYIELKCAPNTSHSLYNFFNGAAAIGTITSNHISVPADSLSLFARWQSQTNEWGYRTRYVIGSHHGRSWGEMRLGVSNNDAGTGGEYLYLNGSGNAGWTGKKFEAKSISCGGSDSGVPGSVNCPSWFRSFGPSGWYNQTYNGGIYMEDTTWVRVYGERQFYVCCTTDATSGHGYTNAAIATPGGISVGKTIWTGGNIFANGAITAKATSDHRLKTNFREINANDLLLSLGKIRSFDYNEKAKEFNANTPQSGIGLVYQQAIKVLPGMSAKQKDDKYGSLNYLNTDYINLIGAATQQNHIRQDRFESKMSYELRKANKRIKTLEKRLEAYENKLFKH